MRKSHWYDWVMGFAALLILTAATFYVWLLWNTFTKQIPVSYSFWGVPTRPVAYGNRGPVLDTAVTGWIITIVLTFISLFPSMWQSGIGLEEKERMALLPIARTMLEMIKLELSIYYSYLMIQTANSARLFAPTKLFLALFIVGTLGFGLYRIDKAIQKVKKEDRQ